MKHVRLIALALVILTIFIFIVKVTPVVGQTQPSTPTPEVPAVEPTPSSEIGLSDVERRVFELESTQKLQIEVLNKNNELLQFWMTILGAGLAFVAAGGVAVQAIVIRGQWHREGEREAREAARDQLHDEIQDRSTGQVSSIMSVVRDTLQSRLDAEHEARKEAAESRQQLDTLGDEVKSLHIFFKNFQKNIQTARKAIEENASQLTQISRHDFKPRTNDLNEFARQFDTFNTQYEQLESEQGRKFSPKALYIRGIAAHYSNQPEVAKRYLVSVTESTELEPGDTENAFKRRMANAYYYLGITQSNFGNIQPAIDSLEQANQLDPDGTDFLTKVVTAEAYLMSNMDELDKAREILKEVEDGLHKKRDTDGRLAGVYLRLQSRATLIQANMAFLKRPDDWESEAEKLLMEIHNADPAYYYGTYTLAQLYALQGKPEDATRLFREALETIERLGDLFITTEARSLILMRMVAGLCSRQLMDEKKSDDHLDKADALRSVLPKIDSQVCTVFSALSKFNERSETIHDHIELIRSGEILHKR